MGFWFLVSGIGYRVSYLDIEYSLLDIGYSFLALDLDLDLDLTWTLNILCWILDIHFLIFHCLLSKLLYIMISNKGK